MNQQQLTCEPKRIDLFLHQHMSGEEQAEFESHLNDCDACRCHLEQAVASDDVWSTIRESLFAQPPSLECEEYACDVPSFSVDTVLQLLAPSDDDRMLGRLGTYEVVGVIGTGGMGVVLKAFDPALNRYVAIKMLSPHLGNSGAARKRFSREAQAAAAVVHDNVIEIHGVADANGLPYLVMPYVRGPSLQKRLDDEGPLTVVEVLRIAKQAADGLAEAHAQGLVHRDVKPANILLADGVERVKLTDFGLARAADDASLTKTGVIAGTPQFMSPEQACGDSVDQRSDLFSLGSVMYTMCTGRPPFRAETSYGILRRITDTEPRTIREVNPDIPDWLCAIITRLMSKKPANRFASADKVAALLEDCLAHVQQPATVPLPTICEPIALASGAATEHQDPKPAASAVGSQSRSWRHTSRLLVLTGFVFAIVFAGILIVLELNKGTLSIESDTDDVEIRITQGDKLVEKLTVTQQGGSTRIAAGQYVVEIEGEHDGLIVENENVTITRGKTQVVKIRRIGAPEEFHLTAKGTLQPKIRRSVFAPADGTIQENLPQCTQQGATVEKGEKLAVISNSESDKDLPVLSPTSGTIITWRVRELLRSRPVSKGQILMTIADLEGPWVLELVVVDKHLVNLSEAKRKLMGQEVSFKLATDPRTNFKGTIKDVVPTAKRKGFTVTVDIDEEKVKVKLPGAAVVGRIHVVHQSNEAPADATSRDEKVPGKSDTVAGTPLLDAIRHFNNEQRQDSIGKDQPPLTDDEIFASIRDVKYDRDEIELSDEDFAAFQSIAETGVLRMGWSLETLGEVEFADGDKVDVWSVLLMYTHPRDDSPERRVPPDFTHTIRQRALKYHPLGPPKDSGYWPADRVTLSKLVSDFNHQLPDEVGRSIRSTEQPLTVDEVVAAVQLRLNRPSAKSRKDAALRKVLEKIVATETAPKAAKLESSLSYEGPEFSFNIRGCYLKIPSTEEGVVAWATGVRSRFIQSTRVKKTRDDEIAWGSPARDGLQVGVQLTRIEDGDFPHAMYSPKFFFRNSTGITNATFEHAPELLTIDARKPTGANLPVKRRRLWPIRDSMLRFPSEVTGDTRIEQRGMPIVIGGFDIKEAEEGKILDDTHPVTWDHPGSTINANLGEAIRLRFRLPNPTSLEGPQLVSGEVRLVVGQEPTIGASHSHVGTADGHSIRRAFGK